jgi:hypothetical protein
MISLAANGEATRKGKLVVRRGRKAMDLEQIKVARLPKTTRNLKDFAPIFGFF